MPKTTTKTNLSTNIPTRATTTLSNTVAPDLPLQLLGNITPAAFMAKYWQKKPLLIRGAIAGFKPLLTRDELFTLAQRDDVESRLIVENTSVKRKKSEPAWTMANGPFSDGGVEEEGIELPSLKKSNWTLLVQGVDLHDEQVHALKNQFRFAPDARLDDVMISFATDGGGVGPHFDSYDVFLLQAEGKRRWRIGKQKDLTLQKDVPLKILSNFAPEQEFVLDAGDMLYLPPMYAHEGVAVGECMTYSIGFRAPAELELARELLQRFADDTLEDDTLENEDGLAHEWEQDLKQPHQKEKILYRDPKQTAVQAPALIPTALLDFAQQAVAKAMSDPDALARHLGEYLTEPKANVWFDEPEFDVVLSRQNRIDLSRNSQMMFDPRHIFLNGMSWRAAGKDAVLMQLLANQRFLEPQDLKKASEDAMRLLQEWLDAGWVL
jgi:50S ribosomal protein L16 3-hydroxylase